MPRTRALLVAVLLALAGVSIVAPSAQAATVAVGNTTVVAQGTATSTATLAKPSGVVNGDVLVAQFTADLTPTVTAPSGWTAIAAPLTVGTGARLFSFLHVVSNAAAEPASYSFPFSVAEKWGGTLTVFHGVDTTHPLDSSATTVVDSSYTHSTLTVPGVTVQTVGAVVISGVGADRRDALFGAPSGTTQAGQAHDGQGTALAYSAPVSRVGAVGSATWSMTAGTGAAGWEVALRPASGTSTPAQATITSATPGNGNVVVAFSVNPGTDNVTGVRACRSGNDTTGAGPWCGDLAATATSITFDKLFNDTAYTFTIDPEVNGAPAGRPVSVTATPTAGSPPPPAAPVSAFSASPTSGSAPLAVQFTDTSSNQPTSWAWAFGDGSTSTAQSPAHTYGAAGSYTVSLTASNATGAGTPATRTITVTSAPVTPTSSFTASTTSGTAPVAVQFTDTSAGGPTAWSWTFGDGGVSTVQNPAHTYTTAGTYTATLTVSNSAGQNSSSQTITVSPAPVTQPVSKVLTIVEENHSLAEAQAGMPYLNSLGQQYSYGDQYFGMTHPSLPNYLAIAGGSTFGIADDNDPSSHPESGATVFGQALSAGLTAHTYAESMPGNCTLTGNVTNGYAVKHNPWAYFTDSAERTACQSFDTPSTNFLTDAQNSQLANVTLLVPNKCNDAHDCSLGTADQYLQSVLPTVLASADFTSGKLAVVITADEDDSTQANKVLTVVLHSSLNGTHEVVHTALNHYSLSAMLSQVSGSTGLRSAATATNMAAAFGLTITPAGGGTPPPPGTAPNGPSGSWVQTFDDEFNGTSLDTTKWAPNWYGEGGSMNGVGTYAHNVSESNGALNLVLESTSAGALVHTDITGGYRLPVGSYAEARIFFPGPSSTVLSNWDAWWASAAAADGWPSSGEHDIAEILSGTLTVNYHSPSGSHNQGAVAGFAPGNSWHTYGLYRGAGFADVYWDGVLVKHYTTDDSGKPEILILNTGNGSNDAFGLANAMRVDYVRAWQPA